MHSDNQQSGHLTIDPIDLGIDMLQKLPGVGPAVSRISKDSVGLETVQADLTTLLTVVKNKRRRDVLHALVNSDDGELALGDVADEVAARENNKAVVDVTSGERKRVYIALQQTHLERMEDAGLVELGEGKCPVIATPDTQPAVEILRELETVTGGDA